MDQILKDKLTAKDKWIRILYMIFFGILGHIAEIIINVIAIVQFFFVLLSEQPHTGLLKFGQSVSEYYYQTLRYLTYNVEEKPYPFGEWPKSSQENL